MNKTIVSVVACPSYAPELVRQSIMASLAPLGGMGRFVRPGMRVLLKPNLLSAHEPERAVTTHPAIVRAVAELVQAAGGTVLIGDSPAGPIENNPAVWRQSGIGQAAEQVGAKQAPFDSVTWKRLNATDYFIARPVLEADLVINLPKLKTHAFTLYTGAVKNLFGVIPGNRKLEVHARAPGIDEFSAELVDVLELVRPRLTVMDAVLGQEGNGPGRSGTPRRYGCLAASEDPVALDAVMTQAMGYRPGQVMLLALAASRELGVADLEAIHVQGDLRSLEFGRVRLPAMHWYLHAPGWIGTQAQRAMRVRPRLVAAACASCGQCVEVCPRHVITMKALPDFDLEECVGCFCCAEVCPQGAIEPQRNLLARMIGAGR
jgi:uncharacterized protein (DUF362 family)/Pyruvate/2-oxoacid:ferredoxin oxidoreductase delta subunit